MASVSTKLFLILSLLCLQYAMNVSGLKCCECSFCEGADCVGKNVRLCTAGQSCYKIVHSKGDGSVRGCWDGTKEQVYEAFCPRPARGSGGRKSTQCASCDNDPGNGTVCNGGNQLISGRSDLGMIGIGGIISITGQYLARAVPIPISSQ